ncbi:hypothetical protein evm_014745 [Chilo suppressalis]|nr:hypothetical protein evm_014745 [Chilo suppressalis]
MKDTLNKIWQDHTIKTVKEVHREGLSIGLKNPSGKGKHLIVLYIWAQDKGYVAESWKRCIDHVIKEEQKMLKLNGIVDDVVDKFIIKVGGSAYKYHEMMLCVGHEDGNLNRACELYRQRFVDGRPPVEQRRLPSYQCFLDMTRRLHSTGSFHRSPGSGRPTSVDPRQVEEVLRNFEEEPTASTRRAAARFGMRHVAVWRILRDDGQHPYHYRRTQELTPADFTPRGRFQHQWRLNVWAGIYDGHVIGPVILPSRLNGGNYLRFLQTELEDAIDDFPVVDREYFENLSNMVFQHDGAPAHFAHQVREYLNARFPRGWIGRGGPVQWPARAPDLTPLDFFLWGYVKVRVYFTDCPTLGEMEQRVRSVFASITPTMLRNATQAVSRRASLCIQQGGAHFEPLL